jgi:hypothetical protein
MRRIILIALSFCLLASSAWAGRAHWGFGVGVPLYPPYVYRPPVYVAPPVYMAPPVYAPPPVVYAPPPMMLVPPGFNAPAAQGEVAQSCDAAAYRCPMERPSIPGNACYCLGNNGQRIPGLVR